MLPQKNTRIASALLAMLLVCGLHAAETFTVTVTHDLPIARPSETIVIPFQAVRERLPEAKMHHITVRDAQGRIVPSQITNFTPSDRTARYDELLWQHDFAAGEQTAVFTIETSIQPTPPFSTKTFARHIPERLDDFAFENDRIAYRTYGPGLETPAAGRERMTSSGIDVWAKAVRYPIIDRWYLKCHDAYHANDGEGCDMFSVGTSRGVGGTGIWDKGTLYVSRNYTQWRVLANGPVRTVFELEFAPWDANGTSVSERKRITIDAGENLHRVESTFTFTGQPNATAAIGLTKQPGPATCDVTADPRGWLTSWITYETGSRMGIGILFPHGQKTDFTEDPKNNLILATAISGEPLIYYIGACWSEDGTGEFETKNAWNTHLSTRQLRTQHPLAITLSPIKVQQQPLKGMP